MESCNLELCIQLRTAFQIFMIQAFLEHGCISASLPQQAFPCIGLTYHKFRIDSTFGVQFCLQARIPLGTGSMESRVQLEKAARAAKQSSKD